MATTYTETTGLDGLVRGSVSKTGSLDAILKALFSKTGDLDALLTKAQTKNLGLDSFIAGVMRIPKGILALDYSGQVGSFAPGDYVIGTPSNAMGQIVGIDDAGATGTLFFNTVSGTFENGDTLNKAIIGSELIINGDMELDANWEPYGADQSSLTEIRSSSRKNSGTYSWYLYDSSVPSTPVGIQSNVFATVADDFYFVDLYINADYVDGFRVVMKSGAGVFGHVFEYPAPQQDQWHNYSITYQETLGGGSKAQLIFCQPDGLTGSWRYYVDDISVKGASKDGSNYATASTAPYGPPLHLDSLLVKSQSTSLSLDAELGASISFADPLYLSELLIDASFGHKIGVDASFSALEIESRFGIRSEDPLYLSALECTSTMSTSERISVDSKLSILECESRFGFLSRDDLKLSALSIDAQITGADGFNLAKWFAPLEIDATILSPTDTFSLDKKLSELRADITLSREQLLSLDGSLSAIGISSTLRKIGLSLDENLSAMAIEASISNRELSLDSKLSALEIESSIASYALSLDASLSELRIEADIDNYALSLDSKLSALEVEATLLTERVFALDSKLSALSVDASIDTYWLSLDSKLSSLEINSTIYAERNISLDASLSELEIDANIENYGLALDSMLSALEIESELLPERTFLLDSKFSALEITSSIGVDSLSLDSKLSAMAVESDLRRDGLTVDGYLSALGLDASLSKPYLSVDANLSALIIDADLDSRDIGLDEKLSALALVASMENYGLSLDSDLSALEITSNITTEADNTFTLDSTLSALTSEIVASGQLGFSLDANLSGLIGEMSLESGGLLNLDGHLSVLEIDATMVWSNVPMSLDGYLSALVMESVGSGSGSDGSVGQIVDSGRFDDYVLRHSRW